MNLQKAILEIRTNQGLTQDEFAEKLHVTRQAVSRWENGETTPTIDTLKKISELFKVDVCEMLGTSCQSCSWPLKSIEYVGTHSDKSVNTDFCGHCYNEGKFSPEKNVAEIVEVLLQALDMYNADKGSNLTVDEARIYLNEHLATLKRWKTC